MQQHFQIVYETKGVKVVNVWIAPNQELPEQWNVMTYAEQDEWLYEHEIKTEKYYEDIHYSLPASIIEIRHLKIVV